MNNDKVKLYKNPARKTPEVINKYVPQYQLEGIEPEAFKSAVVPDHTPIVKSNTSASNPRLRHQVRQPYAEVSSSPVGIGRGPVPNVGNNMEHTWSSVDGHIVDDLDEEQPTSPDHEMIDNNEIVTPTALGVAPNYFSQPEIVHEDEIVTILQDLNVGGVLLLVKGVAICSGPPNEIEDQVRALIFGEHDLCDGEPVSSDDIMVLKKLKMKVGVFLE
jgi:hypothetical protein